MRHLFLLSLLVACDSTPDTDTDVDPIDAGWCIEDVCTLSGTITEDLTLTADKTWVLSGGVFIGDDINPTTLTIEPGTTIYGESATDGFLVIQRSARILAEGTETDPIVFTSAKAEGSRATGDWGGLVINGRAPTNVCADLSDCDAPGEAGSGFFGGDVLDDDSGVLRYVRIEFPGKLINETNELNGLALQGVGSGTIIDHVQIHQASDDGIEMFGGTVELRHLLITGAGDDSMDWTDGWTGKAQYVYIEQLDGQGDNGIEADNNADAMDASPRSAPMLQNITIVGGGTPDAPSDQADIGILLRHGTAANISHAVVVGWGEACVDVDSAPTFDNAWDNGALSGELTIDSSVFWCPSIAEGDAQLVEVGDGSDHFTNADLVLTFGSDNEVADPGVEGGSRSPMGSSPVWKDAPGLNDSFFDATDHLGAVGSEDWTRGWTTDVSQ